ncbi:MAG TPA: aldo/keto reductase [Micropepsaceae bacterium]|jgi:aryl-alcohol dehydrogenase-like predicted oxidoreductase|nr:aldo/keto reductase [Micropepsaceae bacterium]
MRNAGPAELVMGSAQLGLDYGAANRNGKPAREVALRLVSRAIDGGITSFDTARAYGDAEERLAEGLAGRRPTRTITKLAPLSELAPDAPHQAVLAAVDASLAQSRVALRRDCLDCLLLHRANHITAYDGAIWNRLKEHLAGGLIAALGVSVQSVAEALRALAEPCVTHIQLPFNLLDWRWRDGGVIAALQSQRPDVTVHARSIFLQGVLTAGDLSVWRRLPGADAPRIVAWLQETATAFGRDSVADLALAYARGQSWIDGVVVGQETERQLDDNLRLCARAPLSAQDCALIESAAPRMPEKLLDPAQWAPQ